MDFLAEKKNARKDGINTQKKGTGKMGNNRSWEKGDLLFSKDGKDKVMFLGYSVLDNDCFIGEDADGVVWDDFLISHFGYEGENNG